MPLYFTPDQLRDIATTEDKRCATVRATVAGALPALWPDADRLVRDIIKATADALDANGRP